MWLFFDWFDLSVVRAWPIICWRPSKEILNLQGQPISGLWVREWIVFDRLAGALSQLTFFSPWLLMHFYFIDWSFTSCDSCISPTPNHIRLPASIHLPGGLSLCHRSAAALMTCHTPSHRQKTIAGTSLRKCQSTPTSLHPPPTHI